MKQTIDLYQFRDAFKRAGRQLSFSYEGLKVLYDGLMEWEDSGGQEIELDVVALCCDYSEDTFDSIAREYNIPIENDDELESTVIEFLHDRTTVMGTTDTCVVYAQF